MSETAQDGISEPKVSVTRTDAEEWVAVYYVATPFGDVRLKGQGETVPEALRSLADAIQSAPDHSRESLGCPDDDFATDGGKDVGGLYWGEPLNARRFHIFDGGRALCGGWMMTNRAGDKALVTDGDTFREGKDCKTCCRKAGVLEDGDD